MMIGNLIKCLECKRELQPEDIFVTIKDGCLICVCRFCDVVIRKFGEEKKE
jgi:hypothetical protein